MGNLGREQRKSCCKRRHFKPCRNRSLIHKRIRLINTNKPRDCLIWRRAGVCVTTASHRFSAEEPRAELLPTAPARAFSARTPLAIKSWVLFMQSPYLKSLKIVFCISHFSFSSLKCNGPTVPSWRVQQAAEAQELRWQRSARPVLSSHRHQLVHHTQASEHLLVVQAGNA